MEGLLEEVPRGAPLMGYTWQKRPGADGRIREAVKLKGTLLVLVSTTSRSTGFR